MENKPLQVVDFMEQAAAVEGVYSNLPVAITNDHVVRVSVMTKPFYWHMHPNSDETFIVLEGGLCIDLENRSIELLQGQLFTVPKGVYHCTRPLGTRSVNLTVELKDIETIRKETEAG